MKMKYATSTCILAVTIIFMSRNVKSAPLLSLQNERTDQNYDEYVVFDLLEEALVSSPFNIHQLQTTFYSDELVLCLPVSYEIDCITETDTNCSSSTVPFLWTYFDTETFAGRVLLYFTKNHLKSPLFAIRHKFCEYSQAICGITLYLKMSYYPLLRSTVSFDSLICTTLLNITKKVSIQIFADYD